MFSGEVGIPKVYYYGTEGDYNVLAMELLGPSLEELMAKCGGKFTMKTTLMLADQMIQRVEFFHTKHFLHRDVKPSNFLIGTQKKEHMLFIIDLGLARKYMKQSEESKFSFEHVEFS